MEHMQTGRPTELGRKLLLPLGQIGIDRQVKRKALEDVTDELAAVCRRASIEGLSDRQIAATAQVSITTLRKWLGKGDDVERNS